MKRSGIILTVILSILALVVGFGGTTALLLVKEPAISGSSAVVDFEVKASDTSASVGQRLQADGLIRNALAFSVVAKLRKVDAHILAGIFQLSPGWTMDKIISKLEQGYADI